MPPIGSAPADRVAPANSPADHGGVRTPDVGSGLTMGEASRLLGVPAPTMRAWERRYGVPDTPRSTGGHRRFSAETLAQIALLRDEISRGTQAAKAAERVRAMISQEGPAGSAVKEFLAAAQQMDPSRVRAALDASLAQMGLDATLDDVLLPGMRQIGSWWSSGRCEVAHEHLATATVRAWLGWYTAAACGTDRDRRVVLACGPRDQHTIGLEALGALLVNRGLPILLLGARTPARDLPATVRATGAAAVVVASQMPTGRRAAITAITVAAEAGVPVFYAGDAFASERLRASVPGTYLGVNLATAAETVVALTAGKAG
jgi:DNA-binding transcriptional MerR regulator